MEGWWKHHHPSKALDIDAGAEGTRHRRDVVARGVIVPVAATIAGERLDRLGQRIVLSFKFPDGFVSAVGMGHQLVSAECTGPAGSYCAEYENFDSFDIWEQFFAEHPLS